MAHPTQAPGGPFPPRRTVHRQSDTPTQLNLQASHPTRLAPREKGEEGVWKNETMQQNASSLLDAPPPADLSMSTTMKPLEFVGTNTITGGGVKQPHRAPRITIVPCLFPRLVECPCVATGAKKLSVKKYKSTNT